MVAGIAVGLAAKTSYEESGEAHCPEGWCDAEGISAANDARVEGDIGTVLFAAGAAALVAGAITWIASPSSSDDELARAARRRPGPIIEIGSGPGPLGVSLRGRW
jgi:hypothetical protein